MTAFFTRCLSKHSARICAALLLCLSASLHAEGIQVKSAGLAATEEGYFLTADFDIGLNPVLGEALNRGVALYFVVDFELVQPRWYWLDRAVISQQLELKLAYNALTRQYRLSSGALFQNFATLEEALGVLSRVRNRLLLEKGALKKGSSYAAALRMWLDVSQLPKPFQINALARQEWNLSSDWSHWTVSP